MIEAVLYPAAWAGKWVRDACLSCELLSFGSPANSTVIYVR